MLFLAEPILSAYFCASSEAQPGLSIWPERLATAQHRVAVAVAGAHACCKCGYVQGLAKGETPTCPQYPGTAWVLACDAKREA